MTKIRVTQVKSAIDRPERQKLTLKALGLNKMNASREVEANAQILGMVRAVNHLIRVEELDGSEEQASAPAETNAAASAPAIENTGSPAISKLMEDVPVSAADNTFVPVTEPAAVTDGESRIGTTGTAAEETEGTEGAEKANEPA